MLQNAEAEVGCREIKNTNKSENGCIEAIQKEYYGKVRADHYCAIFVSVILERTCKEFNVPMPPIRTARARTMLDTARKLKGQMTVNQIPKRGAIFYLPPSVEGSSGHVGFVNRVLSGKKIETIEGNTSFPKSAGGGYGIPKKTRQYGSGYYFIHLDHLAKKKKFFAKGKDGRNISLLLAGLAAAGGYKIYKKVRK